MPARYKYRLKCKTSKVVKGYLITVAVGKGVTLKKILGMPNAGIIECYSDDKLNGSKTGELRGNGKKLCLSPAMWKLLESPDDLEIMTRTLRVVIVKDQGDVLESEKE